MSCCCSQSGVQPRCVQRAKITNRRPGSTTTQMRFDCQKLLVDSQLETGRIPYVDDGVWLIECPRKEETQEHQEIHAEVAPDASPDQAAPLFINIDECSCRLLGFLWPDYYAGRRGTICCRCFRNVYVCCPLHVRHPVLSIRRENSLNQRLYSFP